MNKQPSFIHAARVLAAIALALFVGLPTARAQGLVQWQRDVEFLVPIRDDDVSGAVRRELSDPESPCVSFAGAVRRGPDDPNAITYAELEAVLKAEDAFVSGANVLFIGYRFQVVRRRFRQAITHVYLIYRPAAGDGVDVPLLYLGEGDPQLDDLLEGCHTTTAFMQKKYINELLAVEKLAQARVVRDGDRIVRSAEEAVQVRKEILEMRARAGRF